MDHQATPAMTQQVMAGQAVQMSRAVLINTSLRHTGYCVNGLDVPAAEWQFAAANKVQ